MAIRLVESAGVLFTPGSALDAEGTQRIGYANDPAVLADGLAHTSLALSTLG